MSGLDELIRELCPDGVEYKRFDEVCTLNARIGWQRLTKAEYMGKGDYLLITGTDFTETHEIDYSTCVYVTEERYKQDLKIQLKNGDILITKDGTLGKVAQVKGLEMPATLNGGVFVVRCKDGSLENRFILHYLLSNHFQSVVEQQKTGSTISHLTQTLFSRLMIPIPPLEIQREIVRILDNFTELTAELTARQKQYAFYRNKLLTFGKTEGARIERIPLGDICSICMCKRILKSQTNTVGGVPFYKIGTFGKKADSYISQETFDEYRSKYNFPKKGDVLISATGTIGRTVVYDGEPAYFQDSNIVWIDNDESIVLNSYLRYCYELKPWKVSSGGTIQRLYNDNIAKAVITVPPLDVQSRIVNVLDNFEKICSDLNIGLPAEIEARQKQYEYYRDKLLTFAETGNTILSRAEH